MSQPDLFVVCKNCGSEVSPYVTECPYCGQRVRKRAPKIDRGAGQVQPKRRGRARRLPRLRADEIAGIAPDTRPYATLGILVVCAVLLLVFAADDKLDLGFIVVGPDAFGGASEEVWRWFTTSFFHADQLGYAFVALVPVAIFGTLLERRFGPLPVLAIFVLGGAAGAGLAVVLETPPLFEDPAFYNVFGANGAALALLCAWLVDDRRAARRGDERDNDLIGVYVIAVVLVLLSLTTEEANIACAVGGALLGAVVGLILPAFTRKGAT